MTDPAFGPEPQSLALIQKLACRHETPFYVYDTGVLRARITALQTALPDGSKLLYSVKANPHVDIIQAAGSAGCGLDLASIGELANAVTAGADCARSMLVGPAKTDAFLAAGLAAGIGTIAVESVTELRRLEALAGRCGRDVAVLLRLSLAGARGSLRMSGYQFGMETNDIEICHGIMADSKVLRFSGYHGYMASQLLDASEIIHNVHLVLDAVGKLTTPTDRQPLVIDLGGGFGVGYTVGSQELDLELLTAGLADAVESALPTDTDLVFESGRYLAGPAGALVCKVIDTKVIAGKRYVLVNGGINASGLFGGDHAMRGLHHSVIREGRLLEDGPLANICGPLCTPMDRLATSVPCQADIDDLIVWWNMGAYGLTAAATGFLSFPGPKEVVL